MANIIDQIIQIDSVAQQKLKDAASLQEQYARDAKRKMEEMDTAIEQKAQEKIDSIRQEEARLAEQEKALILERRDADIARLEKIFSDKHEQLETEIYDNVLDL